VPANAKLYRIAGDINHNTIHIEMVVGNGQAAAGEEKKWRFRFVAW
jgi:hypothetical protein